MLSSYHEFLLESLIEGINESIVYYSPKLRGSLKRIKTDISQDLLDLEGKDIKDDITFIDIDTDNQGYINFTTAKNAKKNLEVQYPESEYDHVHVMFNQPRQGLSDVLYKQSSEMWNKSRNPLKIGRLITKVFPGKYTDKQIEEFTNKFKATVEKTGERFEVVSGDDIAYWYNADRQYSNSGTLGNSCMKNKTNIFDIYTKNTEVCQLLCLFDEKDSGETKLKARALVWKVSKIGPVMNNSPEIFEFFMDRQYTVEDSLVEKMRNYATEKGWAFKTNNNHHSFENVTLNGNKFNCSLEIQLNKNGENYQYGKYPYMDTFRRYDVVNGILHNDGSTSGYDGQYILEDTAGGYEEIGKEELYSEYYDCNLSEDEAVWSDRLEDYLPRNHAVEVTRGSRGHRGWYPDDWDDITYDEYHEEHIHMDDSTYSEHYGYSIYSDDAVSIVYEISDSGECNRDIYSVCDDDDDTFLPYGALSKFTSKIWFKNITEKNKFWDEHVGVEKSLLTKNYNNDWILLKFKIDVYLLKEPIGKLQYMTKMDARLLGIEIDESNSRITDSWTYTEELKESRLIKKLKSAINLILYTNQMEIDFGKEFKNPVEKILKYQDRLKQLETFLVEE